MGTSYLTDAQKDSLGNEFFNLHATFARPIYIFRTAQQIVVRSNPNHNYLFDTSPNNTSVTEVIQSGTFMARILYGRKQDLTTFAPKGNEQVTLLASEGDVRIKLDLTGAAFMVGAQRVEFDGNIFTISTQDRPHGLFDPKFQDFYLKSLQ